MIKMFIVLIFLLAGCSDNSAVPDTMTLSTWTAKDSYSGEYGGKSKSTGAGIDFTWELK